MYILPIKIDENGNFTVNDIETTIRKYYGKWDRGRTYFKIAWLKEALQNLCDMEWIKKVSADNYQIVKTLNLSGDVHDIICSKLTKLIYEREMEEMEEEMVSFNQADDYETPTGATRTLSTRARELLEQLIQQLEANKEQVLCSNPD
ncbi:hypothetical protein ES708_34050 [subsurface metagenome]